MPTIPAWGGRRAAKALERVRAHGQRNSLPCCICDGPIDYALRWPHLMSCSVQHILPRSSHPELTWAPSNWAPAHLTCNSSAGDGTADPYNLGPTSI